MEYVPQTDNPKHQMPKYVPLKPGIKGKGPHLHILIKQEVIYNGKIIRFLSFFLMAIFFMPEENGTIHIRNSKKKIMTQRVL